MNGIGDSSNPYAPPAVDSTPSSSLAADPDVARLIKNLPLRRRVFAIVLSFGGFYALSGAGAVATGIAEGATITSPYLGVGIAALGFGLPLASLGALLALRVRLAQFIAFPLTAVCGSMGGVGFLVAVMRASAIWAKRDPVPTLAILALAIGFLACSLATGWFFHRTVMALARAGVPLDAGASDRS